MELIPGLTNDLARECLIRLPYSSLRSILSVCKAWNSEIQSPDFHGRRALSGHTRPVFVLPQGSPFSSETTTTTYSVTVFDPENGSCTKLPPGPDLPLARPVYCRGVRVGSKVVVFITGGIDQKSTNMAVHVFDFLIGQWRKGSVIPGPGRIFFGLAADPVSGRLLIAGGGNEDIVAMRSTLLYDVASDTWKALADMEAERTTCEVMFHGGGFHVIDGYDQSERRCLSAESLDPDTWKWAPHTEGDFVGALHSARAQMIMENGEGDVYLFHIGRYQDHNVKVRRGGKWQEVVELPEELTLIRLSGGMTWRDKMIVIGFYTLLGLHSGSQELWMDKSSFARRFQYSLSCIWLWHGFVMCKIRVS